MRLLPPQLLAGLTMFACATAIGCGHVQLPSPPADSDPASSARYRHDMAPTKRRQLTTTTTYIDESGIPVRKRVEKETQLVLQSGVIVTWPEDLVPVVGQGSSCGKLAREA